MAEYPNRFDARYILKIKGDVEVYMLMRGDFVIARDVNNAWHPG
jgi:hypothetical protein